MPHPPLPPELGPFFRVGHARARGVSERRVSALDLERPFHGVRAVLDGVIEGDEIGVRADPRVIRRTFAFAARMAPGEFFSHTTAAAIWGVPLPRLDDDRLHVGTTPPHRLPRARGVRGHEMKSELVRVVTHEPTGLRVTDPATTWASLGAVLVDLFDIVAAADAVVRIPRMPGGFAKTLPPPLATIGDLRTAMDAGRRVGAPALRLALPLVRTGSSSRPETWMRLILIDQGLPEPVLDVDVHDEDGAFVGCLDAAYPSSRVGLEYEGEHHRTDRATWNRDIRKHDRLAQLGWRVIRVTATDLFAEPAAFVDRVRLALR